MGEVHFLSGVFIYPRWAGGIYLQILLSLLTDDRLKRPAPRPTPSI
jgi:hypothetical protein